MKFGMVGGGGGGGLQAQATVLFSVDGKKGANLQKAARDFTSGFLSGTDCSNGLSARARRRVSAYFPADSPARVHA